jgi:hypothetical protein
MCNTVRKLCRPLQSYAKGSVGLMVPFWGFWRGPIPAPAGAPVCHLCQTLRDTPGNLY